MIVVVFAVVQRWAIATLRLPEAAYRSPILSLEILRDLSTTLRGAVGLVPLLALVLLRRKEFAARWSDFEHGNASRNLVLFMVLWATWVITTLDHNLFYDQSYNLDRAIIITLAALTWWRPVFAIPHAFLFSALEHQFDHPFGRQIFANVILEDLLLLFSVSLLIQAFIRRRDARWFVFVACTLLASYYWYPGYVKLARGWYFHGQLYLGGFASYANGWLAHWPVETIERLLAFGALVDWPGRVLTMVSELGALFFFVHRRASQAFLLTWAALHVGIWVFSGVSFLVWIALDIAFLVFFFRGSRSAVDLHGRWFAVGGAALMLASPIWVRPPAVGWFDTKLVYTYRYEAIDDRGERTSFAADATPLGQGWCARDFPFLIEQKSLMVRYGKTNDRALADALAALEGTPTSAFALEAAMGQVYYDERQALELDRYLGTIAFNLNRRGSQRHAFSWAAPPRTCLSPWSPPEPLMDSQRPIRQIVVHQLTFVFDGKRFAEIRRVPVRTINVSEGRGPPPDGSEPHP